jgi:riboflavin kinase/FMN adenylyltransferase
MRTEQELANIAPQRETILTIGVFDGVHAGHRYLIKRLNQRAREEDLLSGVVTFNPHPQSILHPRNQLLWLSSLDDRSKELQELGVALIAVLSFTTELAQLSAREFVALLKKYLKMRGLIIGPDFALGRGCEGDANLLRTLGQEMTFSVEIIPPFTINGEIVRSTLIRRALAQGDMTKVERLMGRYFELSAKVISSDKRGQRLGFPTANLDIRPGQALPGNGVYATITQVEGKQFASATNIGIRPTFESGKKTVETHLLDYEGNLYGKELQVKFIHKLRDEQRFASSKELEARIKKDVEKVKIITRELK